MSRTILASLIVFLRWHPCGSAARVARAIHNGADGHAHRLPLGNSALSQNLPLPPRIKEVRRSPSSTFADRQRRKASDLREAIGAEFTDQ
jgi:hypothetical protein